jgi:hypothetical protein
MRVEVYDPGKQEQWDAFVHSNSLASWGHLSETFILNKCALGALNRSLILYESHETIIGVLPLFEAVSHELRFVRCRYLTSAGPLFRDGLSDSVERQALATLVGSAADVARRANVDKIMVTYPNVIGSQLAITRFGYLPLKDYGFAELNVVGLMLDLRPDVESLFSQMKKRCRTAVRAGRKNGATTQVVRDRNLWLSCHDLNRQTLGEKSYSRRAFEVIWDEFISKGFAVAVATLFEGRVASVVVASRFNGSAYYWLHFNAHPEIVAGAGACALWETIRTCKELGTLFFGLGSLEFSNDSKQRNIAFFKAGFGGTPFYSMSGVLELKRTKRLSLELTREIVNGLSRSLKFAASAPRLVRRGERQCSV